MQVPELVLTPKLKAKSPMAVAVAASSVIGSKIEKVRITILKGWLGCLEIRNCFLKFDLSGRYQRKMTVEVRCMILFVTLCNHRAVMLDNILIV